MLQRRQAEKKSSSNCHATDEIELSWNPETSTNAIHRQYSLQALYSGLTILPVDWILIVKRTKMHSKRFFLEDVVRYIYFLIV